MNPFLINSLNAIQVVILTNVRKSSRTSFGHKCVPHLEQFLNLALRRFFLKEVVFYRVSTFYVIKKNSFEDRNVIVTCNNGRPKIREGESGTTSINDDAPSLHGA